MKQNFLLLTLILICLTSNAQKFEHNYLGQDFLLYKGALFKLNEDAITGFSHAFYSDLKYCKARYDNNVIYPEKEYYFNTTKDSLLNRLFIVENIIDKNGQTLDDSSSHEPIFILKDSISKQLIYFKYNEKSEHDFCFTTTKITYDESVYCTKVERLVDDFTGQVKISSPIMIGEHLSPILIYKYLKKGKALYYLSLTTSGSTLNINKNGVTVLFDDGTRWNKQHTKVNVDANSNGYDYSAFIQLNYAELITFTKKKIKKIRLYIYDENIKPSDAEKFRLFVKCVKTTK